MEEFITKKDLIAADFEIIAERYQHVSQFGNIGAQLLHKGSSMVYVEDTGASKTTYLLDKKEREAALKNPDQFLDACVLEWASNEDDPQLSMYQWFPETIKHDYQEGMPCRVLIVGCYYGYEPIQWAQNNEYEDIVFSSPSHAQDWVDEKEKGPYYLKHGEAGRPEYFIIAC